MHNAIITALVLAIAAEVGIPPYFALAIAVEESALNPLAVSPANENGTIDLGVMQLNSKYYGHIEWDNPEVNIRAGCAHLKSLIAEPSLNTYWAVAAAYNCGLARYNRQGPPMSSIEFASKVMKRWMDLAGLEYINPVKGKH